MSSSVLLTNELLWERIKEKTKKAKRIHAALAYYGEIGGDYLNLKKGDKLVVDMSLSTVKSGGTDPFAIQRLVDQGVKVYSRGNLHAKMIVADRFVFVGSANASQNSLDKLDEATIMTSERVVQKRAKEFINGICTEPVRTEYLEICKKHYKSSARKFNKVSSSATKSKRFKKAKLWIVNLHMYALPENEEQSYEVGEVKAKGLIKDQEQSKLYDFLWPVRPKMADELSPGDWIIMMIKDDDENILVSPPGQFLHLHQYIRDKKNKKYRYVFHLEVPKYGRAVPWGQFKKTAKSIVNRLNLTKPKTMPIRDHEIADSLLALWSEKGRMVKIKK